LEVLRSFLLNELLSDRDMAAEMEAGRGAAHYDMNSYLVSSHLTPFYCASLIKVMGFNRCPHPCFYAGAECCHGPAADGRVC